MGDLVFVRGLGWVLYIIRVRHILHHQGKRSDNGLQCCRGEHPRQPDSPPPQKVLQAHEDKLDAEKTKEEAHRATIKDMMTGWSPPRHNKNHNDKMGMTVGV